MVAKEVLNQSISPDERASNPAQQLFDNTVDMASVLKKGVTLTVYKNGTIQYNVIPIATGESSLPSGEHTIFEAPATSALSAESTNGRKKPKEEKTVTVNEALRAKNKRREQNRAIFSGIDGKTVYANGQPVNVPSGPSPENGTKNKTKRHGRRNGSR